MTNNRTLRNWLVFFVGLFILMQFWSFQSGDRTVNLSPSALTELMKIDQVKEITFYQGALRVDGRLSSDKEKTLGSAFSSEVVSESQLDEIRKLAEEKKISYKVQPPPNPMAGQLLVALFWIAGLFLVMWFMGRQGADQITKNGPGAFVKNKAQKFSRGSKSLKTFADVAGCDEAKESLQEVVAFLKNPTHFARLGGKVPRGVLLSGPPGTGKTLLAKAVAGEASADFFSISGSEFVEMFVGVGAGRVRSLFAEARKSGKAIIFIDELDAVGRSRFSGIGGGHDEREQTLNQILVEMDGFSTGEGIIVLAATNRPDVLDSALLRPGRFDRQVRVPPPDMNGREKILMVHAKNILLGPDIDLRKIAKKTPGFVGADLENLLNEAALLASRLQKDFVEQEDIEQSIELVIAGPQRKSFLLTPKEKETIAYHECGHTLAAILTPGTDPVHKVSIISRGQALGYTLQLPDNDKVLMSKKEMLNRLKVLLGGRVAEELFLGKENITAGACDDLMKATSLARRMIMEFGMGNWLSVVSTEGRAVNRLMTDNSLPPCSEKRQQEMDEEIENLLSATMKAVRALLEENKGLLDKLAAVLLEKEEIDGDEIIQIVKSA